VSLGLDQFEAKLQASQDRKIVDIKGQIKDQEQKLDCVINELKMENSMGTLKKKVTSAIEEVTGRIGKVEKIVQNLQREVDKLHEQSLKPTIVAISNACSSMMVRRLGRYTRNSSKLSRGHTPVRQIRSRNTETDIPIQIAHFQSDVKQPLEAFRKELMDLWSKIRGKNNPNTQTKTLTRSFVGTVERKATFVLNKDQKNGEPGKQSVASFPRQNWLGNTVKPHQRSSR